MVGLAEITCRTILNNVGLRTTLTKQHIDSKI